MNDEQFEELRQLLLALRRAENKYYAGKGADVDVDVGGLVACQELIESLNRRRKRTKRRK